MSAILLELMLRNPIRLSVAVLATLLAAGSGTAASAQASVYASTGLADYGFTHVSSDGSISFKGDTVGLAGGAFYDFPIQSRAKICVDVRFGGSPGYKGGFYGGAALRVAFVPHRNPLRPFVELGGGAVHSSYSQRQWSIQPALLLLACSPLRTFPSPAALHCSISVWMSASPRSTTCVPSSWEPRLVAAMVFRLELLSSR